MSLAGPPASPESHWPAALAGRFIVFDGPDGSGKSTQFQRLAARCRDAGVTVCEVREPGGTRVGERIREILLDPAHAEMALRCEMMLYMASRAQLVEERIRPALVRGEFVLADRYVSSTLAYQGAAGGLPIDEIMAVARAACGPEPAPTGAVGAGEAAVGAWPDLVVVFDVDEDTAATRLSPLLDRMEQKGREFHRLVRQGYLDQARRWPERYTVIDATRPPDEVTARLMMALARRYGGA